MIMTPAQEISIQSIVELNSSSVVVVGILAAGFSLAGVVAIWRAGKQGARDSFRMFERLQLLRQCQRVNLAG